jgi:dihydrofolate reductase|tara:strand:+ start:378 stop:878 length:501 start_codon:yes stop_codon:yes gene_type:complete
MIRSIIVAASTNNVIGKNNDLIWRLPVDTKFFKDKTLDHHIIMGRKNFESIPHKFRPLPNRENIIITRKENYVAPNCIIKNNIKDALETANKNKEEEVFIIGGGEIYKLALEENLVDRIYLTRIHHVFDGDTFFPNLSDEWKETYKEDFFKDEKHKYDFTFYTYEK